MGKIVLIEENPEARARQEQDLRSHGFNVAAVARWEEYSPANGNTPAPVPVKLREIEKAAIEGALRANHGNRTHAARQLGISLRKLQYRLKEYAEQENAAKQVF